MSVSRNEPVSVILMTFAYLGEHAPDSDIVSPFPTIKNEQNTPGDRSEYPARWQSRRISPDRRHVSKGMQFNQSLDMVPPSSRAATCKRYDQQRLLQNHARTCSAQRGKSSPLIDPSMTKDASTRSALSAPSKVRVFQWPCGMLARRTRPDSSSLRWRGDHNSLTGCHRSNMNLFPGEALWA